MVFDVISQIIFLRESRVENKHKCYDSEYKTQPMMNIQTCAFSNIELRKRPTLVDETKLSL